MKYTKKALSLFLALVMLFTSAPLNTSAEETLQNVGTTEETSTEAALVDAAVFCSDVHGSTSDASNVFTGVKTSGLTFSTASFAGDTDADTSSITNVIQTALGDSNVKCIYSYGNHDSESDIQDTTGLAYSGNYYVYIISESDMADVSKASAQAAVFTETVAGLDKTKPLFIASHMPLHARRNDNKGATNWYTAISAAAETMDITFFWAHNHTRETSVDTAAYYVAKNGDETMSIQGGSTVIPNFTYMNAGYINANGQNPARKGIATTVAIYEDRLVFQDYNASGQYTGTYTHNVTVKREFAKAVEAEKKLANISVVQPDKIMYIAGNVMQLDGIVVTAIYEDGTTKTLELDNTDGSFGYTVTGWENDGMTSPGVKTITISYTEGEVTCKTTFEIVVATEIALSDVSLVEDVTFNSADSYDTSALKFALTYTCALDVQTTEATEIEVDGNTAKVTYVVDENDSRIGLEGGLASKVTVTAADGNYGNTSKVFLPVTNADRTITLSNSSISTGAADENITKNTVTHEATGIKVNAPGISGITVENTTENETVVAALNGMLQDGYVVYDITLENYTQDSVAEVTMPIPEGMDSSKFVVYYVPTDGNQLEKMDGALSEDGTSYTFITTHFSNYAGGVPVATSDVETEKSKTVTVPGTDETKDVYKLVSSLEAGAQYLIVNTNSSTESVYALGNSGVLTVNEADDVTYIETFTDAVLWTASGDASGWSFSNSNGKLGYTQTINYASYVYTLNQTADSAADWTFSDNMLSTELKTGVSGLFDKKYYLTGGSSWSMSDSKANVYFYKPDTISVGTQTARYGINVTVNGTSSTEYTKNYVVNGSTLQLGTAFTSTVAGQTPSGGTYAWNSDNESVATVDANGLLTFTGIEGTANIKVSYTWTENEKTYTIWNTIAVTAVGSVYTIDIVDTEGASITETVVIKGVTANQTETVSAVVNYKTSETDSKNVENPDVMWTSSNTAIATVDESGKITFTGKEGIVQINAYYEYVKGKSVTDTISFSVSANNYVVPEDGTDDFPEYPNEGAIRFDKTATAVGNFSETGTAQVELSMTGVPYTTGSEIDVVMMLDMTGSMSSDDMTAAEEAAIVFAESIVKNEDGTYNNNRIAVYAFNSGKSSPYELWALNVITADTWNSFCTEVRKASDNKASGGTPYDDALEKCYNVLQTAKTEGRQQFCVFMSDGGPTDYTYITNYDAVKAGTATNYTTKSATATGGTNQSDSNFATIATYTHEYYSTLMKDDGVTVYTVGTGMTSAKNPNGATILKNIATDADKAYLVASSSDTSSLNSVFSNIAMEIKQAATNVVVEDKIADEYTMIFDFPNKNVKTALGSQEFYIEVVQYTLDENKERTDAVTTLQRVYLAKDSTGQYYAASDAQGTAMGYTEDSDGNVTAGAKVTGTASDNITIKTPYFSYDASTKVLQWKAEKLDTTELALRYFLYLDNSAGYDAKDQIEAGTYPTNEYATITYTNYLGNECQQKFPVPQMTWNGAQVSYVFYLVNENGEPVNRAGRVVPFAEAVYVTDVFSYAVLWNDNNVSGELEASYLAKDLLPDVYELYDNKAEYDIYVYEDEKGSNKNNHFVIAGSESVHTTYVFNTKADKNKYNDPGTYYESNVHTGFDFSNTTVAFAVVWKPALVEDTVVVDYGLPVVIDVTMNDALASGVVGISATAPNIKINTGTNATSLMNDAKTAKLNHGTATVESLSSVRYTLTDMKISEPEVFYYESAANFYDSNNVLQKYYMYSSVTVIPATTVYYEDSFVTFNDSTAATDTLGKWISVTDDSGIDAKSAVQATDRPGEDQIGNSYDADNVYGYDSVYDNCTKYSLGQVKKVTVNKATGAKGSNPTAEFTFHGTGFDLISLTDNTSGMIKVTVKDSDGSTVKTMSVNNYYGYTYSEKDGWTTVTDANNALYQVPVIQITGLKQATYTVTVDVMYLSSMDSTGNGEYNFWLDAVRVYDPASSNNDAIKAVYTADKELNPGYIELRDLLLAADDLDATTETAKDGVVFIDGMKEASIADYEAYGPNNEVYLAYRQSVAFKMIADQKPEGIQIGAKLASGTTADLYLGGSKFQTLNSATDRNYVLNNLTWTSNETNNQYESNIIVLTNYTDGAIISLTNLKAINAEFVTSASVQTVSGETLNTASEASMAHIAVVSSYAMTQTAVETVNAIDKVIFVPDRVNASWTSFVQAGHRATLTIITSEDVEAVSVDGTRIENYKTRKVYNGFFWNSQPEIRRVWTYTITAPQAGSYDYSVEFYDADGNTSEPVTATLQVKDSIWKNLFPWLS